MPTNFYQTNSAYDEFCRNYPILCGDSPINNGLPSGIKINTLPNGMPQISAGQTTLDKLLATLLSGMAIIKNQPYVPTTQQPQQQPIILPSNYPAGNTTGTGATFGDSVERFVTNNTGLILVAGAAFLLFKSGRK